MVLLHMSKPLRLPATWNFSRSILMVVPIKKMFGSKQIAYLDGCNKAQPETQCYNISFGTSLKIVSFKKKKKK